MTRTLVTAIVSGAQTGADRGGLDAAIQLGLGWGGWAPKGWRAEDGEIPLIYREHMRESSQVDYKLRTRLNVQDSDGTLILSFSKLLAGGSAWTARAAKQQRKPCKHLELPAGSRTRIPDAVRAAVLEWISVARISVLNVAGPRESKMPGLQHAVRDALVWIFEDEVVEPLSGISLASEQPPLDIAALALQIAEHGHERMPVTNAIALEHIMAHGSEDVQPLAEELLAKVGPCPGCGRAHRAHYCECGHRPEWAE